MIEGFWCASGLAEHAVHFWKESRDTTVERNVLRDNARGIGFGMLDSGTVARAWTDVPCPAAGGGYVDHFGGVARNNVVSAHASGLFASEYGFDCGVCLWQACGAQALHNTVWSGDPAASFSAVEWRFANTSADRDEQPRQRRAPGAGRRGGDARRQRDGRRRGVVRGRGLRRPAPRPVRLVGHRPGGRRPA